MTSRTQQQTGPKDGGTYMAKARERWGAVPEWINALAEAADAEVARGGNQGSLGKRIGMRADMISGAIGNKYAGNMTALEQIVRGKLMNATVSCPALVIDLPRDQCIGYQQRKTFSAANPLMVLLSRTCPGCQHNVGGKS